MFAHKFGKQIKSSAFISQKGKFDDSFSIAKRVFNSFQAAALKILTQQHAIGWR